MCQAAKDSSDEKQKKSLDRVRDFALSDSANDSPFEQEKPEPERKRSVKELLSDFEKKSKEMEEEEEVEDYDEEIEEHDVVEDSVDVAGGTRRRVFSDTETMMYESSESERSFVITGNTATPATPVDRTPNNDLTSKDAGSPVFKQVITSSIQSAPVEHQFPAILTLQSSN